MDGVGDGDLVPAGVVYGIGDGDLVAEGVVMVAEGVVMLLSPLK